MSQKRDNLLESRLSRFQAMCIAHREPLCPERCIQIGRLNAVTLRDVIGKGALHCQTQAFVVISIGDE